MKLDGMVNEITSDQGLFPSRLNKDGAMARSMAWSWNEPHAFADLRGSFHRFRQAGVKHGLHGVRENAPLHLHEIVFFVFVNGAVECDFFLFHEIRRLGKRGNPLAINESRIPADMIKM